MRILCTLSFALVVVACSGASPDVPPDASSASIGQDLTESCEGPIRCLAGSTETSATLHRGANLAGCIVQGATLLPGGVVEGDAAASWTGNAGTVRVCHGPSCFSCERSDGAPPAPGATKPKEKTCQGSVSCPSSPPCAEVRGCNLHSSYHYDGAGNVSYVDYSCDGSATPCSAMTTAAACEDQGCRWE